MSNRHTIGIIGGSGFDAALERELGAPLPAEPPAAAKPGAAPVTIYAASGDSRIAFLPRHGSGHTIAPHLIDHHANIAALRAAGCRFILSTTAVGALRREYRPGDLVVPDDFLDLRGGPPTTLYNQIGSVEHTDFSQPFDSTVREALIAAARDAVAIPLDVDSPPDTIIHPRATYLCVNGPRYETPAEVRCFAAWGADLVGMTVVPEAILARECGLRYATLSVVTNYAAGISPDALSHAEVETMMRRRRPYIVSSLLDACRGLAGIS